jgi:hypothetical protein
MVVPDMSIGQYSIPFLLTIILTLVYKFVPVIPDKWKALLSGCFGVVLAILSMFYSAPVEITFQMWVNTIIGGFLIGMSAVGLYEATRTVTNPRA